jgi:hypothetical protein
MTRVFWYPVIQDAVIAFFIAGIAPFVIGYVITGRPGPVLAIISGTLVLEYAAVVVGTALSMDDAIVFCMVTLVAAGIIFFQLSLFDHIGKSSPRVRGFLEHTNRKYGSSPFVKKYGIFALLPGMLVVGFYVCPAVAWLLGWERKTAFIVMMGAFCAASAFLLPVSEGLLQWMSGLMG